MKKPFAIRIAIIGSVVPLFCGVGIGPSTASTKREAQKTSKTSPAAHPAPTPARATTTVAIHPEAANTITVSGSLTLSLTEGKTRSFDCQANGSKTSAILPFNGSSDHLEYRFQFSVATGTTEFPSVKGVVALYDLLDNTREWAAGTTKSAAAAGTITFDGHRGSVDLDLLPDPPHPNPALAPVHVKGSFTC